MKRNWFQNQPASGLVRSFWKNSSGNISMMFGLALIPMIGGVGAAVDYSSASNLQSEMQSAVDSTVLAIARPGRGMSDADLLGIATTHFRAITADKPDLANLPVTVSRGANTLTVKTTAVSKLAFMSLLGATPSKVNALAQVSLKQNRAELALVLDNTGSMSRLSKMVELKRATINLLNAAEAVAPAGSGLMKFSLVPFDTQVKLDPAAYRFQNWLAFLEDAADASFAPIRARMPFRLSWNGCLENRGTGYETNELSPNTSIPNSLFPGVICKSPSLANTQTLTDNWAQLRSVANSMTPAGKTDITLGARIGLATLSNTGPIAGGSPPGTPDIYKYMILLTDGDNTEDRFNNIAAGVGSAAAIDAKTAAICAAIRNSAIAQNVKIFSVRVIEGNRGLLQNCASSPQLYYEVNTASEIDKVFQTILREITELKLSQ
jgi:Flp pilus assembly protein TadG